MHKGQNTKHVPAFRRGRHATAPGYWRWQNVLKLGVIALVPALLLTIVGQVFGQSAQASSETDSAWACSAEDMVVVSDGTCAHVDELGCPDGQWTNPDGGCVVRPPAGSTRVTCESADGIVTSDGTCAHSDTVAPVKVDGIRVQYWHAGNVPDRLYDRWLYSYCHWSWDDRRWHGKDLCW